MVGPNGMTLYTFDHDALDTSNCSDKCATAWPPLIGGQRRRTDR